MSNRIVPNWMTPNPIITSPGSKLSEAHRLMVEHNIAYLPVISHGKRVGTFTKWDPHKTRRFDNRDFGVQHLQCMLERLTVREMMACVPVTVSPDATIEEAVGLMLEHGLGILLVVEEGKLIGMITESDISLFILNVESYPS
ncbi:MAG TPA: CBS domain-containing protein [Anaerolineales bacterium]|nr:CBS domain-containing protein [Anaerolineales bacterium]